jgi:hypothetical protein
MRQVKGWDLSGQPILLCGRPGRLLRAAVAEPADGPAEHEHVGEDEGGGQAAARDRGQAEQVEDVELVAGRPVTSRSVVVATVVVSPSPVSTAVTVALAAPPPLASLPVP